MAKWLAIVGILFGTLNVSGAQQEKNSRTEGVVQSNPFVAFVIEQMFRQMDENVRDFQRSLGEPARKISAVVDAIWDADMRAFDEYHIHLIVNPLDWENAWETLLKKLRRPDVEKFPKGFLDQKF